MVHSFNPSTGRQRQEELCEFEAILVYIYSEVQDSQDYVEREPVSKNLEKKSVCVYVCMCVYVCGQLEENLSVFS